MNKMQNENWISVKEELPEHLKPCLVYCDNSYYVSVYNRAGGLNEWCAYGDFFKSEKVTHWMYLPMSPK